MPTARSGRGDAIPNDFVVPYYLDDRKLRISIARVGDRLYAFDDLCTCADEACPLSGGLLTGTTIMCQCHGSRFDITTGAVISGPATKSLNVYEVQRARRQYSNPSLTLSKKIGPPMHCPLWECDMTQATTQANFTSRTITVEHIKISSERSFAEVRQRLEGTLPKLDASIAKALRSGDQKLARDYEENWAKAVDFRGARSRRLVADVGQRTKCASI